MSSECPDGIRRCRGRAIDRSSQDQMCVLCPVAFLLRQARFARYWVGMKSRSNHAENLLRSFLFPLPLVNGDSS